MEKTERILRSVNFNIRALTFEAQQSRLLFSILYLGEGTCVDAPDALTVDGICKPVCDQIFKDFDNADVTKRMVKDALDCFWVCDSVCLCVCTPICDGVCDGIF